MFDRAAWAFCVALAALIVLLIAGAQVFSWYWPIVLSLLALAAGLWRLLSALPSPYRVAQELDARFGLLDLLSTAFHFRTQSSNAFAAAVASQAEREASARTAEQAFPWTRPRAFWPMAGLLLAVVALMGIRYGKLQTLALNAPLVSFQFDPFAALFGEKQRPGQQKLPATPYQQAAVETSEAEDAFAKMMAENKLISLDDPEQKGTGLANQAGDRKSAEGMDIEEGSMEEGDDPSQGKSGPPNTSKDVSQKGDGQSGQPQNGKDQPKNSLLDKMRDAMASLMEKMNIPPPGQDKKGEQSGDPAEKGTQMAKGQMSKGEKADSNAEKNSETSEGQGQKSDKGDSAADQSEQPKTGMGRADGKKDVELAQQQEAMGKLSEILGKRSADLRAEVTVEVTNTKQTLRTPYLNRNAAHGEGGGEIHRDEIPLHRQEYIQRYYDAVRRPAPAAKR